MATRNQRIHHLWMDIQDIVGPARLWPFQVRRSFWTRGLTHWQRILVCTFSFVNGLNPAVFLEWSGLLHLFRNQEGMRHVEALFRYRYFQLCNYKDDNTILLH